MGMTDTTPMDPPSGWAELREANPWPGEAPKPAADLPSGWLARETWEMLKPEVSLGVSVLEIGTWRGLSTRKMAAAGAWVVTMDTFQGSVEHRRKPWAKSLKRLQASFQHDCWALRDRIVSIHARSSVAVPLVVQSGFKPSMAYVDGDHAEEAVLADLFLLHEHFPEAVLVGDDWSWEKVRSAARKFASRTGRQISNSRTAYRLAPL
jgi:hypothetical protein